MQASDFYADLIGNKWSMCSLNAISSQFPARIQFPWVFLMTKNAKLTLSALGTTSN